MSRRPRVLLLVAAVALVAAGGTGWWWARRGDPAPPTRDWVGKVHLQADGPRAARVVVEGRDVGPLTRDEQGAFQGQALGGLIAAARSYVARRVEITRDPQVDVEFAAGVQRLLVFGGARSCTIVEPAPR